MCFTSVFVLSCIIGGPGSSSPPHVVHTQTRSENLRDVSAWLQLTAGDGSIDGENFPDLNIILSDTCRLLLPVGSLSLQKMLKQFQNSRR